nr:MAG TPA: hypothetical protein [Caudoviricetes sp.]
MPLFEWVGDDIPSTHILPLLPFSMYYLIK